ncbi:uncharacterized protein LOC121375955 [Gigantopelta aegis]|uniref:uncharacterized protein LOC121375955 n=1 Tax=Gigantopelta aegis TaxID=1735272 RepID=UPI001B888CE6|nr:uncharacterized protein LOC121375955 [Gigantopelta aegis]
MILMIQWLCLLQTMCALCLVCVNGTHPPMRLQVEKICKDWAILTWHPTTATHKPLVKCDVIYRPFFSKTAKVVSVLPDYERTIKLVNLLDNLFYICYLDCEGSRSNNVTFKTGSICYDSWGEHLSRNNSTDDDVHSTPTMLEDSGIAQSTIDMILGIIFGLLGTCIVGAAAYYFWRNYRRRQRILRLFRQPHIDPFESLQNNMEDSSIVQL